ncbi:unnamed protein product [Nippostrongylus brasiliensis]|uniref:Aldo_ket_red domain-containing protein n=1 Tax=Nippostrongylus brasiliensis TaxID=27835 RepID=A0A3P7BN39_NIPBR|nr:unnamed protein product [Nippostrongylus brasiliensis]
MVISFAISSNFDIYFISNCYFFCFKAYSSLGGLRYHNRLFADEDVKELAAKYAITVPQFLLSWGMSQSICVLPCSTSRQRTIENFSATHVRIDNEDVQRLLNNGKRYKVNWDPMIID